MTANKKKSGAKGGRALKNVYKLAVLAMLIAMEVVLNRFLSINTAGLKIGFAFIPPVLAAILFGPVESAIVYALSDFIGAILFPFGPYHPGFTIVAAVMGIIAGLFLNKRPFALFGCDRGWKKIRFLPNVVVPVLINCLLLGLIVNTLWVSQLYGSRTYRGWFLYRLPEYGVMVPVQLILIPALLKIAERIRRLGIFKRIDNESAEKHLKSVSRNESILGLARVTELMHELGDPQDSIPVIHVAGTNGKGSFVAMLSSVLESAGYTVGSFSSPALTGITDSIRFGAEAVSPEELDSIIAELSGVSEAMRDWPTEFEMLTAAAYMLFKKHDCDFAIVECGLGGAGDATNVIKSPLLSVITNVQLDHCDRLGNTVAEIARNKAGIIKPGRPVLYCGGDEAAYAVIAETAARNGSPLHRTDNSALRITKADLSGTSFVYGSRGAFTISLLGAYQPINAANVLEAVAILRGMGLQIPNAAVEKGLRDARWHGRFELVRNDPVVIFDGAHNPDGVELAAKSLKMYFPGEKAVLLMGVMADKDYAKYPDLLREAADTVFTVKPENPRALGAESLAECFRNGGVPAEACESMKDAVKKAAAYAREKGLPLAALGTLYMYAAFTEAVSALE